MSNPEVVEGELVEKHEEATPIKKIAKAAAGVLVDVLEAPKEERKKVAMNAFLNFAEALEKKFR